MSTAEIIIQDTLALLEIRSNEVPITDTQASDGIRFLNRLMLTWATQGINTGFNKVEIKTDETHIPDWMEMCVIYHLAILLAPTYGVAVDQRRLSIADQSMKIVLSKMFCDDQMVYPATLPKGSGNSKNYANGGNFYPGREDFKNINTSSHDDIQTDLGADLTTE